MKSIKILLLPLAVLLFNLDSCTEKDYGISFLNDQDRIGIWVNQSRNDTLEIKSSSTLIRHFYNTSELRYRIEDSYLYLKLPGSETETSHMISKVNNSEVIIQDMYAGIEQTNNAGVFKKISN